MLLLWTKLFSVLGRRHHTYDRQSLHRKWCQQQWTEFFNILHLSVHGSNSFVGKPSPNLISHPVKNSSTLKISGSFLLSPPNISTGVSKKDRFVATTTCVEPWVNNMAQILHVLHFKHRSTLTPLVTAVSYFRASSRLEHSDFRSRFLCFQTANQKNSNLIRKSNAPRALRFSCQGPAG